MGTVCFSVRCCKPSSLSGLRTYLLIHVLADLRRLRLTDLDTTDMEGIHHCLNLDDIVARRGGQSQDTEIRVLRSDICQDGRVRIVPRRLVRFVWKSAPAPPAKTRLTEHS